jgi:cyclophilin family peptidyl-prolyl cis-trans isomerase/HEAT repeat protein
MKHLIRLILALLLFSCGDKKNNSTPVNKFSDPEQIRIAQLADERNSTALLEYLKSTNIPHRESAINALAAAGNASIAEQLIHVLDDEADSKIRIACYRTLGFMINDKNARPIAQYALLESNTESEPAAVECLGKIVAALKTTDQLSDLKEDILQNLKDRQLSSEAMRLGWAKAAFHYHLSGQTDERLMDRMPWVLQKTEPASRLMCAHAMARFKGNWFEKEKNTKYVVDWCQAERNSEVRVVQMNMLAKCKSTDASASLTGYLKSDSQTQQVKVSAIRAAAGLQTVPADALVHLISDPDDYVAAEALRALEQKDFSSMMQSINDAIQNRSAEIQAAGLALMNKKGEQSENIMKRFTESAHEYDRMHYAKAMVSDASLAETCVRLIESEKSFAVKYALTETLLGYKQQDKWPASLSFPGTMLQLFNGGDIGVQALVAIALRESTLSGDQKKEISTLLKSRLESLALPKEVETYNEIVRTVNELNNESIPEKKPEYNHGIDWKLVSSTPQNHRATIHTNKGDIVIELKVDESPGSVASFVALAREGFYNNKYFHRVIPNFVIQGGCPRGDGMGGTDYTLRTELNLQDFTEGAVGLASSGNDTESCQWFITHIATPHLNGRYTVFGYVVEGMEVVRTITVGDQITGIDV